MSTPWLRRMSADQLTPRRYAPDERTLQEARVVVEDVRARGATALLEHAIHFGDVRAGEPWLLGREALAQAYHSLPPGQRELLLRTASRIQGFARAQRQSLVDLQVPIPGGMAGHCALPVERAGCYAPGGRFPLPSSVLMTAGVARVAGVSEVWVASPRPAAITLAAAHAAQADGVLAIGGAQAIAALAYGAAPLLPCDMVVGPGNRWVTAAKQIVSGDVAIDMLAGPSELVVLADAGADPSWIAADLLAQAEHDPDAWPVLVALGEEVVLRVEQELTRQLGELPTAEIARQALRNGFAVLVPSLREGIALCNRLAPEHLSLAQENAAEIAPEIRHCGALFLGPAAAEVLGDYGAGPNHVLPTGGTARHRGGLSVLSFLKIHTWLRIDRPAEASELARDAEALARLEGLHAHAGSARRRLLDAETP